MENIVQTLRSVVINWLLIMDSECERSQNQLVAVINS